jgi:hypothetical protein
VSRRRIILLLGLCSVAIAVAWWFLGDPQKREARRIKKTLAMLAEEASFGGQDQALFSKLAYPGKVAGYFAESVYLDIPSVPPPYREDVTRSHLESALAGFRASFRGLSVQFLDIVVELDESLTNAVAHLTAKIYVTGDTDYGIQEFRIGLQKVQRDWLISRIATVRTMDK